MRWNNFRCLLLIVATVTAAKERPKRHLPLLQKIASHILGTNIQNKLPSEENYKLYKIPGLDNILIKAIPRVAIKEAVPKTLVLNPVGPSIALVKSYIDTESDKTSVTTLQNIENLLRLVIFNNNREDIFKEVILPINSQQTNIKYKETETNEQYEVKSPGLTEMRKPVYVVPTIDGRYTEAVDIKPVAVNVPSISVIPGQVKITQVVNSTVPTKYSYKQSSQDGVVTTYESEDNPNVVVTKTATVPVLPQYIKVRIQEAAVIGVNPPRVMQSLPTFPAYPQPLSIFGIPRSTPGVLMSKTITPSLLPPPIARRINYIAPDAQSNMATLPAGYKILDTSGYLTEYDGYGPPIFVSGDEYPIWLGTPIPLPPVYSPIIDVSIPKLNTHGKVNVNISKKYEGKPGNEPDLYSGTSSYDLKSPSKANNNYQDENTAESYKGIPAPPPMINAVIDNGPVVSKYSYKLINHKNSKPFTIVEIGDKNELDTNMQNNKININSNSDSIPNNYLYVPPTGGNIENPPVNNVSDKNYKKRIDCKGNDGASSQLATIVFNCNPIVVPDDGNFVYKQNNADGSSISIKGNADNTVSVHVEESRNVVSQDGNGDNIPGAKF